MPVGLFRSEDGGVQVDYGTGTTFPIPRPTYEANGYKPDFDQLPSEAECQAAEEKEDDDTKGAQRREGPRPRGLQLWESHNKKKPPTEAA
jgi:hypothetical protein